MFGGGFKQVLRAGDRVRQQLKFGDPLEEFRDPKGFLRDSLGIP